MGFSAAFSTRYEVLRTLGQGGMGQVLLAKTRSDGRSVAIKVIAGSSFTGAEARARFLMEAAVTARLDHPAIVRVLEHGADEDQLYIVLELVTGGDLDALIKQGPLPPAAFWQVALPVVDGFVYAHASGVLHRDIKPANILLDETGAPRIADFGIAKDLTGGGIRTATGLVMGTPAYLAPELARGERATAATDQYAAGVMLYEMLTGVRPFQAQEPLALLRMHLDDTVPTFGNLRNDAPPGLEALVRRMLEKQAAARFPDLGAVGVELARIRASAGDTWRRRVTRKTSGRTAVATLAAASVPAAPAPLPWRRALLGAVAALAVAGVAWNAQRPRNAAPLALDLRVRRELTRTVLSWDPPLRADRVVATVDGVSREASGVTSIELSQVAEGPVTGTIRIEAGGAVTTAPVRIRAISAKGVIEDLRALRWALSESERAPEPAVCRDFGRRMAGPTLALARRHPAWDQLPGAAADAAAASGLTALLEVQRARGLTETLERAARVLDARALATGDGFAILAHVNALCDLHTLAELHRLIAQNEPLRFLYGRGPGPLSTRLGPKLAGAGDYRRSGWKLALIEAPDTLKADRLAAPPLELGPQRAHHRVQTEEVAPQGIRDLIALEYYEDQKEAKTEDALDNRKLLTRPFRMRVLPGLGEACPQHGEVVVKACASDRAHLDVTLAGTSRRLCFRFPSFYRDRMTVDRVAQLAWRIPSRALVTRPCELEIAAHSVPGDGLFRDVEGLQRPPWEVELDWLLVSLVSDPRDYLGD